MAAMRPVASHGGFAFLRFPNPYYDSALAAYFSETLGKSALVLVPSPSEPLWELAIEKLPASGDFLLSNGEPIKKWALNCIEAAGVSILCIVNAETLSEDEKEWLLRLEEYSLADGAAPGVILHSTSTPSLLFRGRLSRGRARIMKEEVSPVLSESEARMAIASELAGSQGPFLDACLATLRKQDGLVRIRDLHSAIAAHLSFDQ
ncbi:MAG: hypothetical protein WCH98_00575 [Verrucomicrobiota bacterium]